jgi:hypothetical protein
MPFRDRLSDRQAAAAGRARMDWQYLLGGERADPGCDFSVLRACRDRLLAGEAAAHLLAKLLARCRSLGWLKARGQQRTDAPHGLAALRALHRLALVAEPLRAARKALATVAPAWRPGLAPLAWDERAGTRSEETRRPPGQARRDAYAPRVGAAGLALLDALEAAEPLAPLRALPVLATLRQTWQRHDARATGEGPAHSPSPLSHVRFTRNQACPPAAAIESPDDPQAPYRQTCDTPWTGDMGQVSETCEPTPPHRLTPGHTTTAAVYEAQCTAPIHEARSAKDRAPREPCVDGASISAALRATSRDDHGRTRRGPTRPVQGGQAQTAGAYALSQGTVDWAQRPAHCPQGKVSTVWRV